MDILSGRKAITLAQGGNTTAMTDTGFIKYGGLDAGGSQVYAEEVAQRFEVLQ